MIKITNILFALIFTVSAIACNSSQNNKNLAKDDDTTKVEKVEVYYFHGTRICATCIAVEEVSSELVKDKYCTVDYYEIAYPSCDNRKQRGRQGSSGSDTGTGSKGENNNYCR